MPTYQYRCLDCANELEVVQKFTDDALTDCPDCDGTLRKVYSAVGVVFKGSGFYATDSRAKAGPNGSPAKNGASGDGAKADTGKAKDTGGRTEPAATSGAASGATAPTTKAASTSSGGSSTGGSSAA